MLKNPLRKSILIKIAKNMKYAINPSINQLKFVEFNILDDGMMILPGQEKKNHQYLRFTNLSSNRNVLTSSHQTLRINLKDNKQDRFSPPIRKPHHD